MRAKKDRRILTPEELARIFDDKFIRVLVQKGKLPLHADIERFAMGLRDAAFQYVAGMVIPSYSTMRVEIKALYSAASRYRYKETAALVSKISERTRALLKSRGDKFDLAVPEPEAFRDPARHDEACETIDRLLCVGWKGNKPRLYMPEQPMWEPPRRPSRRKAELEFVSGLRLAYLHATGEPPAYTANPERPGPFARMVQACLDEIAPWANAVALINELDRRRKLKDRT
jgi:hypothetical protein